MTTTTTKLPGYRGLLKELGGKAVFALIAENGDHPRVPDPQAEIVRRACQAHKERPVT